MNTRKDYLLVDRPAILEEFMSSLQRLFKICIYYPSGHIILDKATDRFMRQLKTLAGDNPSVTIRYCPDSLMLEDIELNSRLPFVQDIKTILTEIGVTAITFAREISASEVHAFIRKLLFYKSRMQSKHEFSLVEISDLPHTVTIEMKEFMAREDSSISDRGSAEAKENVDLLLSTLADAGLSPGEVGQCRKLLKSLSERLVDDRIEIDDLPYASWDDVARLLVRTFKGREPNSPSVSKGSHPVQGNINALISVLSKLEHEVKDSRSREVINLLVSIVQRPELQTEKGPTDEEKNNLLAFPEEPELQIKQIQEQITNCRVHRDALAEIAEFENREEMLSILMQLAHSDLNLQSQVRMQYFFREILSGKISAKTWEILSGGMVEIAQKATPAKISLVVRQLIEIIRDSRHGNSLFLLLIVVKQSETYNSTVLWPYVVNELLVVGSEGDKVSYRQLCEYAAAFSLEEMRAALPQLVELDAFQDNAIATDIFYCVEPQCYPLFSFLLQTSIEQYIGKRIIGGLRRDPPDWLMKALASLLDYSRQDHKLLLSLYLDRPSPNQFPAALKFVAAKIVVDDLSALAAERRQEKWVRETISTCAKIPTREIVSLLKEIANEKKLLVFSGWTVECRKAAAEALAAIKKNNQLP